MQLHERFFMRKANQSNFSLVMNHIYIILVNDGNNYLRKVKANISKEFFRLPLNIRLTYTHYVNIFKMVNVIYLKLFYISSKQNSPLIFLCDKTILME